MHNKGTNLLAVLLLAGLVLMAGCPKKKTMPTVTISAPSGSVELMAGDSINFTATLENPDNVKTTIDWTATGGTLASDTGLAAKWTAPADSGHFTIYAIASGEGLASKDTNSKAVLVRTWARGNAEGDNIEHIDLLNPGDTVSTVSFTNDGTGDDSVPAGALVDSASVEIDISFDSNNPDSMQDMDVWIKSPDGTSIQVWQQTQSGSPTGEYGPSQLAAFKDKPATGTWKLEVHALSGPLTGWIDDFHVTVWYRKSIP